MSVLAIAPLFLRPSALNPIQSCFVWSFGVFGIMGAAIQGRRRSNTGRISTKDDAVLPPLRTAKTVVWLALSALWASASLAPALRALGSAPLDSLNPPRLFVAHPCGWPFIRPSSDRDSSKGRKIRTVSYTGPVSRFRSLGPSGAAQTSPNFPHDNFSAVSDPFHCRSVVVSFLSAHSYRQVRTPTSPLALPLGELAA